MYKIISARNPVELEQKVNQIGEKEGLVPTGGVAVMPGPLNSGFYFQAVCSVPKFEGFSFEGEEVTTTFEDKFPPEPGLVPGPDSSKDEPGNVPADEQGKEEAGKVTKKK